MSFHNVFSLKTVGLVCCLFISEQDSAQHFADLAMIENEEAVRPAFVNSIPQTIRKI